MTASSSGQTVLEEKNRSALRPFHDGGAKFGGGGRRKNKAELRTSQVHSSDWEGGSRWAYRSRGGHELSPQEKVRRTYTHACRVLQSFKEHLASLRPKLLLLLLLLSLFSRARLCATPWTAAHQAPLSLGFSRQEHWRGLPFPSPMHESEK